MALSRGYNVSELKSQMNDLAKPFLFNVEFPANQITDRLPPVLCRSAQIPAKTIAPVEIPYHGLPLKLAGNPTFEDWTTQFIVDDAYKIRSIMESWSNKAFRMDQDGGQVFGTPSEYLGDIIIQQLDPDGSTVASYKLHMAWPSVIGPIELGHETVNAPETFDVTFTYSFWTKEL